MRIIIINYSVLIYIVNTRFLKFDSRADFFDEILKGRCLDKTNYANS